MIVTLLLSTAAIYAGEPAPMMAPAPAPAPTLTEWFIAGSYGQFDDVVNTDADMYALQVGRKFTCMGGFDVAAYLEVAYFDGSNDFDYYTRGEEGPVEHNGSVDTEIIPVTLNLVFERNLVGGLGFYAGGGLGYAWNSVDTDPSYDIDDNGGFYGQLSMGLNYEFTEAFSVFAGARWIYLGELEWGNNDAELEGSDDNAWGWEVGLRYSF